MRSIFLVGVIGFTILMDLLILFGGWRSIVSAKSLVNKGLIKRVGTWSSISVWNDPWLLTTRPRPANKNQHNLYPDLTMDSLIDPHLRRWNSPVLRALVDPHDVKLIESIPLSRTQMLDRDGWHFTKNGKYTVKSGYQIKRVYPDREKLPLMFGPTVDALKPYCWKIGVLLSWNIFYGNW